MQRYASTDIPSERHLIEITLARIARVASLHGMSPHKLCKVIVRDNKVYDRLRSPLRLGPAKRKATITLALYARLHKGLDKLDLPIRETTDGTQKGKTGKIRTDQRPSERPRRRRSGASRRQHATARRGDVLSPLEGN